MPSFKDSNNKEWTVRLDAPTIREVRSACSIDLGALDGKVFDQLDRDPVLLVDVLWVICKANNQLGAVTDADFGRALVGEPIAHAAKALTDAWLDFFPERKRSLLRSLADKHAALTDQAIKRASERMNDPALETRIVAAMEAKLDRELEEALMRLSGANNLPESSESEPKAAP